MRAPFLISLAIFLASLPASAVVGLKKEQLGKVYGAVQEEGKSVYGDQFGELMFLTRSASDGNTIIVAATMMDGRCHAVSYLKNDAAGKPVPLTDEEVRNQMVASSKSVGGVWKQVSPKEWRLDPGPEVPGGLKAQWTKPELFQVFTRQMLEKLPAKR